MGDPKTKRSLKDLHFVLHADHDEKAMMSCLWSGMSDSELEVKELEMACRQEMIEIFKKDPKMKEGVIPCTLCNEDIGYYEFDRDSVECSCPKYKDYLRRYFCMECCDIIGCLYCGKIMICVRTNNGLFAASHYLHVPENERDVLSFSVIYLILSDFLSLYARSLNTATL
jgi:hypothetical protein